MFCIRPQTRGWVVLRGLSVFTGCFHVLVADMLAHAPLGGEIGLAILDWNELLDGDERSTSWDPWAERKWFAIDRLDGNSAAHEEHEKLK